MIRVPYEHHGTTVPDILKPEDHFMVLYVIISMNNWRDKEKAPKETSDPWLPYTKYWESLFNQGKAKSTILPALTKNI